MLTIQSLRKIINSDQKRYQEDVKRNDFYSKTDSLLNSLHGNLLSAQVSDPTLKEQLAKLDSSEEKFSHINLTDKLVRDDLQLDAINHPIDRNSIANYFQLGATKQSYSELTKELEGGVRSGNMSFQQMGDIVRHDIDYYGPNKNANKPINKLELIERDSQESVELAEKMTPGFSGNIDQQLEHNLSQGNLTRAGLENEIQIEQTVGRMPENVPDVFNTSKMSKADQQLLKGYTQSDRHIKTHHIVTHGQHNNAGHESHIDHHLEW